MKSLLLLLLQVFVTATARTLDLATALIQETGVLLIVSPEMKGQLLERFDKYIFPADKVAVTDISSRCKMFSLIGPAADDVLQEIGGVRGGGGRGRRGDWGRGRGEGGREEGERGDRAEGGRGGGKRGEGGRGGRGEEGGGEGGEGRVGEGKRGGGQGRVRESSGEGGGEKYLQGDG